LKRYRLSHVTGDAYAGETFKQDFRAHGIRYERSKLSASELYEALEPRLNAGEVELPDLPILQEQLLTLVQRGSRVTHEHGAHDDWACACAGAVHTAINDDTWFVSLAWVTRDRDDPPKPQREDVIDMSRRNMWEHPAIRW